MLVKVGKYTVVDPNAIDDRARPGKPGKRGEGGDTKFGNDPTLMNDVPRVGDEKPGVKKQRELTDNMMGNKAKEFKEKGATRIYKGKKATPNWKVIAATSASISKNAKFKKTIQKLAAKDPLVDWKGSLKKFFDRTLNKKDVALPNRRFVAGGKYLYGTKPAGKDQLRTIVCAVDTSGSISQLQSNTFVKEVAYLCEKYKADTTYIIYCSDDIDAIDVVKKRGTPDLSKWASTGGNAKGFIPPFAWAEKNKIKPSIFVYLTDTGGDMPDVNSYGIKAYEKKVFWFICGPTMYNKPPFGTILFAPTGSLKGS